MVPVKALTCNTANTNTLNVTLSVVFDEIV
jgi:hypothetical protein